ncbi:signal peptidase I [Gracilibacillus halotolerans]|uniref:Signal peptidase I n=1 Tax=Gracilibacillus halotolerans TaxID=74386 RepID=A0A841RBY0_9BACI|nr:signal peptidase I [Gracilibacillus halotolerans]MBB6511420.1 signal peptidase I [Gracilibacillus halotolerans]
MTSKKRSWTDWLKLIIILLLILLIVRMFTFNPLIVEGPSMQPTLMNDDRIIVDKISLLFKEPERFDIVVFHTTSRKNYIKRIIGLPGETIEYKDDILYVNNKQVDEPFITSVKDQLPLNARYTTNFTLLEDIPGGYNKVPDGHVFVLGDNRPNSTDSRRLGYIPTNQITGIARFTYWPLNEFGLIK